MKYLLLIINAASTPGTHPNNVSRVTIMIDPQPLSITASGGKMMQRRTRQQLIFLYLSLISMSSSLFLYKYIRYSRKKVAKPTIARNTYGPSTACLPRGKFLGYTIDAKNLAGQ
jgi:hypothetical protein